MPRGSRGLPLMLVACLLASGLAGCLDLSEEDGALATTGTQDQGLACPDPCDSVLSSAPGDAAASPDIAVNPADPDHMVAVYYDYEPNGDGTGDYRLHTMVTEDGGRTWDDRVLPRGDEPGTDPLLADRVSSVEGSVAFLPDGTVLLTGSAYKTTGPHVAIDGNDAVRAAIPPDMVFSARSDDGGRTWHDMVPIHDTADPTDHLAAGRTDFPLHPRLATGPSGEALLVFHRIQQNDPERTDTIGGGRNILTIATSDDGGRSWSPILALDAEPDPSSPPYQTVSQPAIADDGTFYIASSSAHPEGGDRMVLMRSDDGGASWETTWLGPMGDRTAVASLDVRTRDGGHVIHVAYPERGEDDMSRPVYQVSRDGGTTWSEPTVLDVATSSQADRRPAVRMAGNGAIVTWYQPLDESTYTEFTLEAARILADGTVQPLQVSQDPVENSAVDERFFVGQGYWMGLASVPGGAYAVWEGGEGTDKQVHGARLLWEAT